MREGSFAVVIVSTRPKGTVRPTVLGRGFDRVQMDSLIHRGRTKSRHYHIQKAARYVVVSLIRNPNSR